MKKLILTHFGFLLCLFLLSAPSSWAGNPNDYLHTRTYAGVLGTSVSLDNTTLFNGKNYSRFDAPNYEIDLIPKLEQSFGFGLFIGHREEAYAVEVSYWQSSHNASFGPVSITSASVTTAVEIPLTQGSAVVRSVNLDFKRYFFTETQTQPFINLGVSFPWITVPAADSDKDGNVGPLSLAGLGLNLGVGLEYYFTPNLSLVGGAVQRWASFDQAKGFSGQYITLAPYGGVASDGGSGLDFFVGTTFGFQ